MRWHVCLLAVFVVLALQTGLRPVWSLPWGPYGDAAPSLLLILAAFISLRASRGRALAAAVLIGMSVDLTQPVAVVEPVRNIYVLGPAAIGFMFAAYIIVQLRGLVFIDSLLTLTIMTFIGGLFQSLATVAILTLRGVLPTDPIPDWHATAQLMQRLLEVFYSAALALPVGWLLRRTRRWWGFEAARTLA
jgi:hypothetical protein